MSEPLTQMEVWAIERWVEGMEEMPDFKYGFRRGLEIASELRDPAKIDAALDLTNKALEEEP